MGIGAIYLLKKRTFFPLFLTQFFGAFNDNAFKFAMLTLISYHLSTSQAQSERYQAIAGAIFIIPFFIFSATAGQLADQFNKAGLTRVIKLFEVGLMGLGSLALYFGNIVLLMITLTGLGIHATFFGPIKYAILPDQLPRQQLLGANALIEASTFLAILLGTIFGTLGVAGIKSKTFLAIVITCAAALVGLLASFFILPTAAKGTAFRIDWNVWRATYRMIKQVTSQEQVMPVIIAISWFWLVGALMLTKLPDYTNFVLHADVTVFAVFLTCFSVGIASGSMTINRLLSGSITLRYVPYSMLLLSFFAQDLYWASPSITRDATSFTFVQFFQIGNHWRIAADLFLLAFSGGLFVVPLYTYLQVISDSTMRARTIAANNIINALFMVIGTGLLMVLLHFYVTITSVFIILAVLNVIAALVCKTLLRKHG